VLKSWALYTAGRFNVATVGLSVSRCPVRVLFDSNRWQAVRVYEATERASGLRAARGQQLTAASVANVAQIARSFVSRDPPLPPAADPPAIATTIFRSDGSWYKSTERLSLAGVILCGWHN